MHAVLTVLGLPVALVAVLLAVQFLTGWTPRAYDVLPLDASVQVRDQQLDLAALATAYQPQMLADPEDPSPPLEAINYEVIDAGDHYVINYYYQWQDEVHPSAYVHAAYRLYRAARYGTPVRDIEYLQVDVDAATGQVAKVRFETTFGQDYQVAQSVHQIAQFTRQPDGSYAAELTDLDGDPAQAGELPPLRVRNGHAQVGVATWNHLTTSVGDDNSSFTATMEAPLRYLTETEYRDGKYARRSQGDYRTDEGSLATILGRISTGMYFLLSGIAIVSFIRRLRQQT